MENKNQNVRVHKPKQQDPVEMIKKYADLLWQNKTWIILSTVIATVLWFYLYHNFLRQPPLQTASVMIKFDDPRFSPGAKGVSDFGLERTEGKVLLLTTNKLLSQVVDSLKLNVRLITKGITRASFFERIQIKENPQYGIYYFEKDSKLNEIGLYFTNKREGIEEQLVLKKDLNLNSNIAIDIEGLKLILKPGQFKRFDEIKIEYVPEREVVEDLKVFIQKELDISRTLLTISYSDRDPELAAAVINTVANIFVDQLLEYKRYRTSSEFNSLKDQLDIVQKELEETEENLRLFRERNPFLILSQDGANVVNDLTAQQSELSSIEQSLERIHYLVNNKSNLTGDNRNAAYEEILSEISSQNQAGSQVMFSQYTTLVEEKERLINQNYTEDHILVKEASSKIKNMQAEIDTRVDQFISQLQRQKVRLQNTVNTNENNIKRLPRNELRLAELERNRQVKSNIYSNILVRYNEAKVADASITPDAFIVEEALVPYIDEDVIYKIKKYFPYLLGPILGLSLSIGVFIIRDFLDKSVKTSSEVEEKLKLTVLATIPVIIDEKETPEQIDNNSHLEEKLITSSYAPSIANEKFRLLRTKLYMQNKQNRSFIVTSLTAGDGKSLITSNLAITFAQQKISTLLLDCDLRRGVQHNSFKCNKKPGISDLLVKSTPLSQSEISPIIQTTHVPNLFFISSGIQVPNPSELLGSSRMEKLLSLLKEKFSVVIIDTPPIEFIADALVLNSYIHNILVVVRYGKTNLNKISDKIEEYANIKDDFMGVIINASAEAEKEKYQSYSYYHY